MGRRISHRHRPGRSRGALINVLEPRFGPQPKWVDGRPPPCAMSKAQHRLVGRRDDAEELKPHPRLLNRRLRFRTSLLVSVVKPPSAACGHSSMAVALYPRAASISGWHGRSKGVVFHRAAKTCLACRICVAGGWRLMGRHHERLVRLHRAGGDRDRADQRLRTVARRDQSLKRAPGRDILRVPHLSDGDRAVARRASLRVALDCKGAAVA